MIDRYVYRKGKDMEPTHREIADEDNKEDVAGDRVREMSRQAAAAERKARKRKREQRDFDDARRAVCGRCGARADGAYEITNRWQFWSTVKLERGLLPDFNQTRTLALCPACTHWLHTWIGDK